MGTKTLGSWRWLAPELLTRFRKHTKQTDVYALGVILFEIATLRVPFIDTADMDLKEAITAGKRPIFQKDDDLPKQLKQLIKKCWHQNPTMRPTTMGILQELSTIKIVSNNNNK